MNSDDADRIAIATKQAFDNWLLGFLGAFRDEMQAVYATKKMAESDSELVRELAKAQQALASRHNIAANILADKIDVLFTGRIIKQPQVSFEELTLIDDIEVERYVKRARMVTYLVSEHRSEIKLVEAKLNQLKELGVVVNPAAFKPSKVFEAMQISLDAYELGEYARNIFVGEFEKRCVPLFVEGYRLIATLLAEEGVEAKLEFTNVRSIQKSSRAKKDERLHHQELIESLEKLTDKISQSGTSGKYDDALGLVMSHLPADVLGKDRSNDEAGLVDSLHARKVQFAEKLLSGIAANENVDARVRELVRELLMPLVIITLKYPEDFSEPNHPGRMLLRELTLFGQSTKGVIDRRIDEVTSLVKHAVLEGVDSLKLLSEVAESIWRISEQEMEAFVASSRAATKERVMDLRIKEAKRRVAAELRDQLVDHRLPEDFQPFVKRVLGPWMVIRYLRYGHNSKPWIESMAYMRLAFRALETAEDIAGHRRKKALRKHLVDTLNKRARKSSMDQVEIQKFVDQVDAYLARLNDAESLRNRTGREGDLLKELGEASNQFIAAQDILDVPAMHKAPE